MSERLFCPIDDAGCCDSCHEDVEYGFGLDQNDFLDACCDQLRAFEDAGIDLDDENAVRAFLEAST